MSEKLFKIESMDMSGPKLEELNTTDTLIKLNNELKNNKFIFIDGKPAQDDIITEDNISKCKTSITIVNQLIGG